MATQAQDLFKHVLGFDPFLISRQPTYPPFNVKDNGDTYIVEVACAGFSRNELDVSTTDGELVLSGKHTAVEDATKYIHNGIAARAFSKKFILEAGMSVLEAGFDDGILWAVVQKQLPKQSKRITIK